MTKLPALAGASMGLLLGVLLGLSTSPVAALTVGALTALLSSIVLPRIPAKGANASSASEKAADIRAASLGVMCVLGTFLGLYMRTHDSLSPSPKARVEDLVAAGAERAEAQRAVLSAYIPSESAPNAQQDKRLHTLLFAQAGNPRCSEVNPSNYATVAAAIEGYRKLGEPRLERIAVEFQADIADEMTRQKALKAVVEAMCSAV